MTGSSNSNESLRSSNEHGRYRSPQENGGILSVPALNKVGDITSANRNLFHKTKSTFAGESLFEYRKAAQQEVLEAAQSFSAQFHHDQKLEVGASPQKFAGPLFVTGHQPQFVHPGVWAKNLAVGLLAQKHHGVGLNLIVDNDVADRLGTQIPAGSHHEPYFQTLLFDDPQQPMPWEEVRLRNREQFEAFGNQVSKAMSAWGITPSITEPWKHAVQASSRCDCTVLPLVALRVQMERQLGIQNLEIPISLICETNSFLQFTAHLIEHHEKLFTSYNDAVKWYRRGHGIKNDRHPVADLERYQDRYELPFWFWSIGDKQRQRLFVRRIDDQYELSSNGVLLFTSSAELLVAELQQLQRRGKLRTKALTTTMFMRVAVADLFVHGIGGAKYDEITDRIIAEFFEIPAPTFLALSATMHLPLQGFEVKSVDEMKLEKLQRELYFNAEQFLETLQGVELRDRKQRLIQEQEAAQTTGLSKRGRRSHRSQNRKRFLEFQKLAVESRQLAADKSAKVGVELQSVRQKLRANTVLKSREFPAVLFPPQDLEQLKRSLEDSINAPEGEES